MSRFANLADKPRDGGNEPIKSKASVTTFDSSAVFAPIAPTPSPSRIGRKAISAYFSPEMSLAMHVCARKRGLSLQALMAEAFDDVLRKYGESPIGG
ncbi:ribbon-helix-helix domain-containing protein [Novosphingobium sp.]|uniref:ribbon-helix-helix domain-containing protein n=1 Tax=Novosphingobium sp. TaxID=1874826 RepID=UPI003B529C74